MVGSRARVRHNHHVPEASQTYTSGRRRPCFRAESEMLPPLTSAAPALLGTRGRDDAYEVFYEVAVATGVPDMLVVRFDKHAIETRERVGCGPIVGAAAARAVSALVERPLTPSELAVAVGMSEGHVRRTVLPALAARGAVHHRDGVWATVQGVHPLVHSIVAVEAKRRDWRSALKQAHRYARFANVSFMALDAGVATVPLRHAGSIASMGVGLVTVDAGTGRVRVCRRPRWRVAQVAWEAFLIGERLWELASEGRRSGPPFAVFGRTPDPTPDVSPRAVPALG